MFNVLEYWRNFQSISDFVIQIVCTTKSRHTHTHTVVPPPPTCIHAAPLLHTLVPVTAWWNVVLFPSLLRDVTPLRAGREHPCSRHVYLHTLFSTFLCLFFFFLPPPLGLTLSSKEELLRRSSGSRCRGVLQVVTSGEGACLKELTLSNSWG